MGIDNRHQVEGSSVLGSNSSGYGVSEIVQASIVDGMELSSNCLTVQRPTHAIGDQFELDMLTLQVTV